MHRAASAAALFLAAAVLAACDTTGDQACFEANALAYPVHAPGDTSVTFRWPGAYLPVRVYAEPIGHTEQNTDSALHLWVNALRCGELAMQRVSDSTIADVVVRNPAQLPPVSGSAALFADSVGACLGRTDVDLDSLDRLIRPIRVWVAPFNIDTVAVNACYHFVTAHEIGHALGLFSHSAVPGDLMHAVPRRRAVTTSDRYTVQLLYRVVEPNIPPEPR